MTARRARLASLDARLVAVAKKIRILGSLSWPNTLLETFLEGWRRGEPALPIAPSEQNHHDENLIELAQLRSEIDQRDPVGRPVRVFDRGHASPGERGVESHNAGHDRCRHSLKSWVNSHRQIGRSRRRT